MVTVACVLKSGGDFTPEYVYRLRDGIKENTTTDHRFVCLTDLDLDCETIRLRHNYSGWWSKLELFYLSGKVIYFDLDTVIAGNIDAVLKYPHKFTMLSNLDGRGGLASGMLAFDGDYQYLVDDFTPEKGAVYKTPRKWGDQGWLADHLREKPERFQDLFQNILESYKWGTIEAKKQASIIIYHGKPRPHQTNWAKI